MRFHRLPHIDIRVPHHKNAPGWESLGDRIGNPGFLAPSNKVVNEHTHPGFRSGAELFQPVLKVINPVKHFHHDALNPQVCPPHFFHKLSIMFSLYPDA